MKQRLQRILSILLLGSLSACSMYNESFDCPSGTGVGCKPLSTVDEMIERGQLPRPTAEETGLGLTSLFGNSGQADEIKAVEAEPRLVPVAVDQPVGPVWRVPEKTMRVWVKGYPDNGGNYHTDAIVYTVVRPASWSVQ